MTPMTNKIADDIAMHDDDGTITTPTRWLHRFRLPFMRNG
jgi:hypothetical protein